MVFVISSSQMALKTTVYNTAAAFFFFFFNRYIITIATNFVKFVVVSNSWLRAAH